MAEQEACASAVTEALAAAGEAPDVTESSDTRGESLLLPLLQGLLGGGGERLLAGLGAAGADVVADVRRSLARLRAALAPPTDHPQARALLTLADRLEDALDAADRLDGCKKKPRRRSRAARHTVGVTHEELEEARRLVDRDQLAMNSEKDKVETVQSSGGSSSAISTAPSEEPPTPERKQSVEEELCFHDAVPSRQKQPPVVHSVSYEATPVINRDAQVVERRAPGPKKPDFFRHSIAEPQLQPQSQALPRMERRDSKSGIAAIANKFNAQIQKETPPVRRVPVNHAPSVTAPIVQQKPFVREDHQRAPLYKPLPPTYNFAAPPPSEEITKPMSRFSNNKRNRMKRANTIDIGRPYAGYQIDSDTDDEANRGPLIPQFQPQTENDKKFVAFMQKNEENATVNGHNGHTNWSNRFGNIKNTFERSERDDRSRSSSSSSAKRFWQAAEDPAPVHRPVRKVLADVNNTEIIKPPWAAERREPIRGYIPPRVHIPPPNIAAYQNHLPIPQSPNKSAPPNPHQVPQSPNKVLPPNHLQMPQSSNKVVPPHHNQMPQSPNKAIPPSHLQMPQSPNKVTPPNHFQMPQSPNKVIPTNHLPIHQPPNKPVPPPAPHTHMNQPPVPQSPTKSVVVKPFAAKPIPVNQFSHAPMSAFKPLKKIVSPTNVHPSHVWSPPMTTNIISPTMDQALNYPISPKPIAPSPPGVSNPPWAVSNPDKPRRTVNLASKFEGDKYNNRVNPPLTPPRYHSNPPTPPTYAPPQIHNYPVHAIPSQNNLAAPELVKKINTMAPAYEPPMQVFEPTKQSYDSASKIDAQRLQIEFYEKQIREKNRREANGYHEPAGRKLPASKPLPLQPTYTVTDFTPTNLVSTFVPLQQTPDIEKARAHKVDYLPDVVMNETNPYDYGTSPNTRKAPDSPHSAKPKAPHTYQNGDIGYTNGTEEATEHGSVETRVMRGPVRGAATITAGVRTRGAAADSLRGALDRVSAPRRQPARHQVRVPPPVQPGPAPPSAPPPAIEFAGAPFPRSPLATSRESVLSSESPASCGSSPLCKSGSWHQLAPAVGPKSPSPRKVVSRAKSMHLLSVPKLFEGGIARDDVGDKKKTVEAYFSGRTTSKSHAANVRARAQRSQPAAGSYALGRSRTMPTVSELQFLDESNADDAFEDLVLGLA